MLISLNKNGAFIKMNRYDRLIALCGTLLGIFAFILTCTALSSRNWEIETNIDYFRSSSKYHQLHLSRIMSIFSLIFTCIGILASSFMIIK
jgi:formate hydrogenlyase subunit 3/multisubunit Na+/H+ antiporter MnhD subunit